VKHRSILVILFTISIPISLFPQQLPFSQSSKDAFAELEGELTLYFLNALDGNPIADASVNILGLGVFITDSEGKIRFPLPEEENDQLSVSFRDPEYLPSDFSVGLSAGTILYNRFSVSPILKVKYLRTVLDWGAFPKDLDAHFIRKNGYHISFRNSRVAKDGSGKLDRDDRNGFGPETITVKEISKDSEYEFFVHDYTNRKDPSSTELSASGANVKVFGEGRLLRLFRIPADKKGTKWEVFKIIKGQIVEVNEVSE